MSEMMPTGAMPTGAMPTGATPAAAKTDAISQNMSAYNPSDAAMMAQSGQISKDMTVADLITKVFKVPLTAPASALVGAMKTQLGNRNMAGKAKSMSGAPPTGAPMQGRQAPPSSPSPMGAPPAAGGGMAELMERVGGR